MLQQPHGVVDPSQNNDLHARPFLVVDRLDPHGCVAPMGGRGGEQGAHPARRVGADRLDLDDARHPDVPLTCDRLPGGRRQRTAGEDLEVLMRDPVLLADPHRLQLPATHVSAHCPHMQAQQVGNLINRVETLHKRSLTRPLERLFR
ncbi:hypothetical protein FMEAI12_1830026 [Parafrankia sp. Ea1.12]|nr:hypothetical protein FMEAI12_1830026 [Parafrankia sp. Ea1.12]